MTESTTNPRLAHFQQVRRIVVKVGSQVLTWGGGLNREIFAALAAELAELRRRGLQVILVSSGAVAAGRFRLGLEERPKAIPLKQACAATGQPQLMSLWSESFAQQGLQVAQVLLTYDDLANRRRYLNAQNTLSTLLELGVVPIINENDTVAVEEIQLGDNDRLSALVTNLVHAELLLLLTDVDGFYNADPRQNPEARRYSYIRRLEKPHLEQASATRSDVGLGGMVTKLEAARQAALSGAATVMARGLEPGVVGRILAGEDVGTFIAAVDDIGPRKHWIAYTLKLVGRLVIDEGATQAVVERGKSLLPSGLLEVQGNFRAGGGVAVVSRDGRELARGLVAYGSEDLRRLVGSHSWEIEERLGYKLQDEVIHRDFLVLTGHHWPQEENPAL